MNDVLFVDLGVLDVCVVIMRFAVVEGDVLESALRRLLGLHDSDNLMINNI